VKDQNLKRIKPVWKEICKKLMMSFKKKGFLNINPTEEERRK
jgi:hypothetical protein